jgi:hypothetical protein
MSTSHRLQEIPPIRDAARTGVIPPVKRTVEASRLMELSDPGHPAQIERLLIHMNENPRAGRRRGKQQREQRKGKQLLQVKGPRAPLTVPEKEERHPFGQSALRNGQPDRQHPDEEVGYRFGETDQCLLKSGHAAGQREGNDHQESRHGRGNRVGAPQTDRHDGYGKNTLSRRRKTGGRGRGHQGHRHSHQKNGDQEGPPLLAYRCRSIVPDRSVFTFSSVFHSIRRFDG